MPPDLTVITPIAPHHMPLFEACAASVAGQSVAVTHLYKLDEDGQGPGAIRNELLRQVVTPLVTFLDADDWLEPTFAEETLRALPRGRYIYTDWYQDGQVIPAPECAWPASPHLVTAVLPLTWVHAVGGFDEGLIGLEDTDFYLRLVTRGYCGKRLAKPLVHYRRGGGRADRIHRTGEINALQAEMARRYGGKRVSCCGGPSPNEEVPAGERFEGDVLAQAQWGGNHQKRGVVTGRLYPRTSFPHLVWVDWRDVEASPEWWQVMPEQIYAPKADAPSVEARSLRGLAALHNQMAQRGAVREAVMEPGLAVGFGDAYSPDEMVPVTPIPNIAKVVRLAKAAYGEVDVAVFVKPREVYPSYEDLWKLAELSGFEVVYQDEVDLKDARQTYIFAAPESIPDCSLAKATTIFWALEYVGDYVTVANAQTVDEIWSSDPDHARRTGAKYVLLGSHRHLNPDLRGAHEAAYDLTMLAYMTGRRSAIKDRLKDYRWAADYPGYVNAERHNLLRRTRLMVHVHQHDQPALTPLRLAVAAAYRLPVVSEAVPDPGIYRKAVIWSDYDSIPSRVRLFFDGKAEDDAQYADKLHSLLCVEHPFRKCVAEALGNAEGLKKAA